MKPLRWLGNRLVGASRHLSDVFVAVLTIPVLPDIAVELFGSNSPAWRNPALRIATVLAVVGLFIGVDAVRHHRSMRRGHRAHVAFTTLRPARFLILAVNPHRANYRRRDRQEGNKEIGELLVHATAAQVVIGVVTPEMDHSALTDLIREFQYDGIELVPVTITDAFDPETVLDNVVRQIVPLVHERNPDTGDILVDVTGGTAAMTMAMLRLATVLGARCTYVSTRYDRKRKLIEHTQQPHEFEPRAVMAK